MVANSIIYLDFECGTCPLQQQLEQEAYASPAIPKTPDLKQNIKQHIDEQRPATGATVASRQMMASGGGQ